MFKLLYFPFIGEKLNHYKKTGKTLKCKYFINFKTAQDQQLSNFARKCLSSLKNIRMKISNNQQPKTISYDRRARWNLLPSWIQFFTFIFLLFSIFGIITGFNSLFQGNLIDDDIYGLSGTNIKNIGELILIINMIKLLVVYGYFFQKDWAIKIGITDAIIGLFLCIIVLIISVFQNNLNFPFQGVILLIYLENIRPIRQKWENLKMR